MSSDPVKWERFFAAQPEIAEVTAQETTGTCQQTMTVAELDAQLVEMSEKIKADMEAYDERAATEEEGRLGGRRTTEFALEALQRQQRFNGEHDCARRWLRECAPLARIFTKLIA